MAVILNNVPFRDVIRQIEDERNFASEELENIRNELLDLIKGSYNSESSIRSEFIRVPTSHLEQLVN